MKKILAIVERISTSKGVLSSYHNMIIGIDCDEVLCSTLDELIKMPEFAGTKRSDFYCYNPLSAPGLRLPLPQQEYFYRLFRSETFWDLRPLEGAQEKIQLLKEAGHELVVITGRAPFASENTKTWVEHYYPGAFSDFLFAGTYTEQEITKAELCEQRGIQLVIEDDPFFVTNLSENGIPCILLDSPWNQDFDETKYPNVIKIAHWNAFDLSLLPSTK